MEIYVYVMDTMADWELGHVMAELTSRRYFKQEAQDIDIKIVSCDETTITTMGGFEIVPNCTVKDMLIGKSSMLLLPGGNTWGETKHQVVIKKAKELLEQGGKVAAICGATNALADYGILDTRVHTSNGVGCLDMTSPNYKGKGLYRNEPCVSHENLITANSASSLLWAKHIIEILEVFNEDTLECWEAYFSTGNVESFFKLMRTLPDDHR